MATYTCYKNLKGKTLKYGDIVILKGLQYEVRKTYLNCKSTINDEIFHLLMIPKVSFCKKYYEYDPGGGAWPVYRTCDYDAPTKVCLQLFLIIETGNKDSDLVNPKKVFPKSEFTFTNIKKKKVKF